jgi:hypothetical protein
MCSETIDLRNKEEAIFQVGISDTFQTVSAESAHEEMKAKEI